MNEELKSLIEDAAKLLSLELIWDGVCPPYFQTEIGLIMFNPLDPERGDLMKVAQEARLGFDFLTRSVWRHGDNREWSFENGDHQSLAIAVLRAASAVYKSHGGV